MKKDLAMYENIKAKPSDYGRSVVAIDEIIRTRTVHEEG
jgi:hypothetical protein